MTRAEEIIAAALTEGESAQIVAHLVLRWKLDEISRADFEVEIDRLIELEERNYADRAPENARADLGDFLGDSFPEEAA